jgi:hypothetical protein
MNKELQKKAEDFIIERYKIAKCYREDNAETREYMRMDVHSQYEEEYQLYLDATKELRKENAELKQINSETLTQLNLDNGELITELTKAKEIIRDLLGCLYSVEYDRVSDLEQAEQFLKEDK